MRICTVLTCSSRHEAKGYCRRHYAQVLRHGHIRAEISLTLHDILEIARRCPSYNAFSKLRKYLQYAKRRGWIDEVKVILPPERRRTIWTKELVYKDARKYNSLAEWRNANEAAMRWAYRHGLIRQIHKLFT